MELAHIALDEARVSASSHRHEAAPRACAATVHCAAAGRCHPHETPAHPRRCADSETAKDRHHLDDPGASRSTGGARRHAELSLDVPSHRDRQAVRRQRIQRAISQLVRRRRIAEARKPHGLRKAACRRLAEAGCSANEIASISGHASLDEEARYTKAADQARLARNALAKAVIR
jgi:integrase